ncbi:Potassium channel tetramerization-type BTB domain containing protein [Cryptosporidium tyzzeri]|nr:Potassium channel tetramerization-type BTB domain containing protein [Cryptosporidium tyzzeri]
MNEKRIKLNVGGIFYETTNTTLLSVNGDSNYFSAYLSRTENSYNTNLQSEEVIELFIDRNGFLFQYILDYLRTGTIVAIPNKDHIIRGLLIEADFYLLESLCSILSNKLLEQSMEKLNSNINLIASQSQSQNQSQCQIQSQFQNQSQSQFQSQSQSQSQFQSQSQSQIYNQSQTNMSDISEFNAPMINDIVKKEYLYNSHFINSIYTHYYDTENNSLKENENNTEKNYLKFEFSLDEDF